MSSRCATNSGIFQNFNCALFFILAWLTATFNHTLTLPCHNWCTDQILESLVGYSIYHLFERDITYPYHDIVVTTGVEQYYYIILNDTTQNHSEQSIFAQRSLLNSSFFLPINVAKYFLIPSKSSMINRYSKSCLIIMLIIIYTYIVTFEHMYERPCVFFNKIFTSLFIQF